MDLKSSIESKSNEFIALCKTHDVETLYAFGSATNGKFDETTSDIDLLVELKTIDPIERGEKLMDLWDKFEGFFQRKVDLLTSKSIRNPFLLKSIESSKILIYDGQRQEISF
ncbi:nucleotidyltransferase family protein [Flavobacterium selenitireducens]|uniref:nucleotidyltransferase family protein n=1 Tax=Flavobacterium selenitireducens TaxID=2722704 RepID=UPI00168B9708|nr:nucleotidyltransferase domain-containing protein [Flavobacterium selenitireducens]MBD3584061.1 nucleotidyltransferase domain-containing protein [Flavobacterium selenitireducens]